MGNLGFSEIMIILLVVLLVFGAKRLPEMGASIGKGLREFKRSLTEKKDEVRRRDTGGDELLGIAGARQVERRVSKRGCCHKRLVEAEFDFLGD